MRWRTLSYAEAAQLYETEEPREDEDMASKLVKIALRREDDGTPVGHPAPCYFLCPCGAKIPVYDRQGHAVGMDRAGNRVCACGRVWDYHGYLVSESA